MRAPRWMLLICCVCAALAGCGGSGDKYVGTWELVAARQMGGQNSATSEKLQMTITEKNKSGTYPIKGWDGKAYFGTIQQQPNGEERLVFYLPGPVVELNQGAECYIDPNANNNLVVSIMPESMVGNNNLVAKNASTLGIFEFKKKQK